MKKYQKLLQLAENDSSFEDEETVQRIRESYIKMMDKHNLNSKKFQFTKDVQILDESGITIDLPFNSESNSPLTSSKHYQKNNRGLLQVIDVATTDFKQQTLPADYCESSPENLDITFNSRSSSRESSSRRRSYGRQRIAV